MTVQGREHIKSAYRDEALVRDYIEARFADPLGAEVHRQQVARINATIRRARPASLLEIACGPARLTPALEYVGRSVALEQSPAMLAQARQRLEQAGRTQWTLVRGDAFELPFAARSFEMVVTSRFLRHFDRENRCRLLEGIRRVLRPGGWLLFDVAHASAYKWLLAKWGVEGSWVDDYWFEREEFLAEMRAEGFAVDALHPVHAAVRCQHYLFSYLYPRLPRLTTAVSRSLTRLVPIDAYEWVAVCRSG